MKKWVRTPPFAALSLLMLVVLGTYGVAYAAGWGTTIRVKGTVATGSLKVIWQPNAFGPPGSVQAFCFKTAGDPSNVVPAPTVVLDGADPSQQTLTFSVQNAMPGLVVSCSANFQNVGSITAKTVGADLQPGLNMGSPCVPFTNLSGQRELDCPALHVTYTWGGAGDLTTPGGQRPQLFFVEVKPGAPQGSQITFQATTNFSD